MHPRLFVMLLLLHATNAARAQVNVQVQECGLKSLQVCALHVAQDEVGIVTVGAATAIALDKDNEAMQAVGFDTPRQNE